MTGRSRKIHEGRGYYNNGQFKKKNHGVVKNKQTIIARINKQKNTLHVHQTFLYIFNLIRCHHTTKTWNFPKTWRFLEDVETTTNFLFAV